MPGICLKGKVSGGHCTFHGAESEPWLGEGFLLSHGLSWDLGAPLPIQIGPSLAHLLVTRHLEKLSPCFIWQDLGTIIGLGSTGQETKAHRKMPHDSCQALAPGQSQCRTNSLPAFGFVRRSTLRMWKPYNGSCVLFRYCISQCNCCTHSVAREKVFNSWAGREFVCLQQRRLPLWLFEKECVCLSKQNFPEYLEE